MTVTRGTPSRLLRSFGRGAAQKRGWWQTVKGYLEIRYLDAQAGSGWITPFALLAALMARPATVDRVLDLTEDSSDRWFEAARDGLADPVLRHAARRVIQLGADSLDHLDLTGTQHRQVLDDLSLRVEIPTSEPRSA